jgi:threonine dehydratase
MILAPNLRKDANIYLKTENLQVTGSFKVRGAYFKISRLSEEEKARGVIACSAGNHAQGVALAAARSGIKSVICLPDGAPISKVEATKRFGAEVCMVKGVYDDAYNKAIELRDEHGYSFIHPFNDPDVIAGQGTIGLEIMEQLPNADVVIVPIGGGGLIAGVAYTIKQINPNCRVYGVQAAGAPSMQKSIEDGEIETLSAVQTIADGIAVKTPGTLTYELVRDYVDGIVTVSDDEIALGILTLLEQQKLIAEGAGAVPVAALLAGKIPDIEGKNVCCLVSGGNIDVTILSRVIERGLKMSGRTANITIALSDKPGQLTAVSKIISETGANVTSINYDSTDLDMNITDCYLRISVETRDYAHIVSIKQALKAAGFEVID